MIGQRVRLAREACRMTQEELAEAAGISQGTLSDLEAGRIAKPAEDILVAVSAATQFPASFFLLGPLPDLPDGHNRKLKRGTSKVTKQIRAQVRQIVEIVQRAETGLRLPAVRIEPVPPVDSMDGIEDVAERVRSTLGIGESDPVSNLTRAVERAGVVVIVLPNEMEDHDGFSAWPDYGMDGRPIIAIARGGPGDRDRFTIAHELGHLVLHTLKAPADPAVAEVQAHRFAGALLLPREVAIGAMRPPVTLQVLKSVKAVYGISIAACAQRALDLQLIDREHFVSLRKQLSRRGWNKGEPVTVEAERPMLISKVLELTAGEGPISARAQRVDMQPFAFRALVG
jgi:Zn-dependent peptidase ImmA (M78 family)/transcriptional regulator with XRE-family HTH domain